MLNKTVLFEEHKKLGALMAPFAGWEMPIHYGSIIEETKHTRNAVSIFDICHMGEFLVTENPEKSSFDKTITNPAATMKSGTCKYGFLLNNEAKVLDDLIVYRIKNDKWMVVVNAANRERDASEIKSKLSGNASFEDISDETVKIDVQGPRAFDVMKKIAGDGIKALKYYTFDFFQILGKNTLVSRTGYTGELGFEIYTDTEKGVELWQLLMKDPLVKPAGLGARDILRLESGYPLYGDELTEETSPIEAGMERFIDFGKEFTGKESLLKFQKEGVKRKLTGITIEGRRTPRHINKIVMGKDEVGFVTSGVFSPHLNRGIGFAYIDSDKIAEEKEITIIADRWEIKGQISSIPFIKNTSIKYQEK